MAQHTIILTDADEAAYATRADVINAFAQASFDNASNDGNVPSDPVLVMSIDDVLAYDLHWAAVGYAATQVADAHKQLADAYDAADPATQATLLDSAKGSMPKPEPPIVVDPAIVTV